MSKYFQECHTVIAINEATSWQEIEAQGVRVPRGWFELMKLDRGSRLEFVMQFWLSKLKSESLFLENLPKFFMRLDDILFFLVQAKEEEPFIPHLVYSLKGGKSYYYGTAPMESSVIEEYKFSCGEPLPLDYLAFSEIHETYVKSGVGIIYSVKQLQGAGQALQRFFKRRPPLLFYDGVEVDLKKLIPFYSSFGRYSWQCFCADWFPEEEMGNVLVSHDTVFLPLLEGAMEEGLAFPTFLDFLAFFLEIV